MRRSASLSGSSLEDAASATFSRNTCSGLRGRSRLSSSSSAGTCQAYARRATFGHSTREKRRGGAGPITFGCIRHSGDVADMLADMAHYDYASYLRLDAPCDHPVGHVDEVEDGVPGGALALLRLHPLRLRALALLRVQLGQMVAVSNRLHQLRQQLCRQSLLLQRLRGMSAAMAPPWVRGSLEGVYRGSRAEPAPPAPAGNERRHGGSRAEPAPPAPARNEPRHGACSSSAYEERAPPWVMPVSLRTRLKVKNTRGILKDSQEQAPSRGGQDGFRRGSGGVLEGV
eukprot:1195161-Prorocentrum_minimum.AAC.2